MRTLFFSKTELRIISDFWEAYQKLRAKQLSDSERQVYQQWAKDTLADLSPESAKTLRKAIEDFETNGIEFEVRIAPDDAKLVSQ